MRYYFDADHYTEFLSGKPALQPQSYKLDEIATDHPPVTSIKFRVFKVVFDYTCALVALPLVALISFVLMLLNPFLNPGPLFYTQERAGRHGKTFKMWKFRSMVAADTEVREPGAALEEERITQLGRFLRLTRTDELPNFFNVLLGQMSVVGPRPEAASHAAHYEKRVPGYRARLRVKPGITGLAQVEQGYVESEDAAAVKAMYDNMYVQRLCGRLDLYVIYKTFGVIVKGIGAR